MALNFPNNPSVGDTYNDTTSGFAYEWDGTIWKSLYNAVGNADIYVDTTPQLGGDLDLNSNDITGTGNINITGIITATSFDGSLTGNVTGTVSSISNHDTGDLTEGTNLYYTDARVRSAISVTDSGGDGSLSYNSGTGAITYTGPSATEVRAHFSGGTGVSISSGEISIGQEVATTSNVTFNDVVVSNNTTVGGGLTVTGNLVVNGTTTTINSTTISVDDKNIELGSTASPSDSSADGGGITLKGTTDHTISWSNTNDSWDFSEHVNIVTGKEYRIADTSVLSATTLGSGVVNSSLTSVGTITSGTWQGTSIANAYLANSTISGVSLGSNLNTLTLGVSGTGLSGSQTYNGSGAATFTVTSNATNANTASTIVSRDASGNFSAGTISAALSGNASTASALATARSIGLGGDVSGSANFDGSSNITITATVADDSHNHIISNVDGLQTALDGKLSTTGKAADSNLLDGIDSGSFLRSDAGDSSTQRISFQANATNNWDTIATSSGNQGSIEVYNSGSGNDAFMSFHASGDYAFYFGLDATTNDLAVGGWSMGANKYKVWHAGNDGSGSGLDADTVDGLQASSFKTTSATDTNNLFIRNGSPTLYLRDTDHNVSMVHCNSNLLYVLRGATDSTTWTQVSGQWPFIFNLTNNAATCGGSFTAVGDIQSGSSDRRLKENFKYIKSPLEKVLRLNGYTFDWKINVKDLGFTPEIQNNDAGLIAQEVQEVLPQAVSFAPFDREWNGEEYVSKSGEDYLTVQYEKVVPLLVEAIKEQQKQIDTLTKRIEELGG